MFNIFIKISSVDRGNISADYDDQNKSKQQSASANTSGLLAITSKLVGSGLDSSATTSGVTNATDLTVIAGLTDSTAGGTGDSNHAAKNTNPTSTVGQFSNEVDEDGYSIQPPKEVAWDENKETGRLVVA